MYVCLCRSITDKQIKQAACQGVRSNRDLNQLLGKKPDCGQCGLQTRKLIQETIAEFM